MLSLLLAAAQLSAPAPVKYPTWFSTDDNPKHLVDRREVRKVGIRVIVSPSGGKPQACEIESRSGDDVVDAFTCGLVMKRASYSPARWMDGTPAFGVDRLRVVWGRGDPPPASHDIDVSIRDWPRGVRSPTGARVILSADRQGHPLSCVADQRGTANKASAEVVRLACEQLVKTYRAIPVKNLRGEPVPSVQNADVLLSRAR
jgi:hypothetical protein